MPTSFFYLASPYSSLSPNPVIARDARQFRYREAMRATAWLLSREIWTYSPIVHCHEMAHAYSMPTDAAFWSDYNEVMIMSSRGIILLQIDGWFESVGCADEIGIVRLTSKTIQTMTPSDDDYILEDNPNPYSS